MYSFVNRKGWFLTMSFVPGLAVVFGDYKVNERVSFNPHVSFKLKTMNALGYNGRRFYAGLHIMADIFGTSVVDRLGVEVGRAKSKLFFGYRFRSKN